MNTKKIYSHFRNREANQPGGLNHYLFVYYVFVVIDKHSHIMLMFGYLEAKDSLCHKNVRAPMIV